jgi:hypothetical protein
VLIFRDPSGRVEGVFVKAETHLVAADAAEGCEATAGGARFDTTGADGESMLWRWCCSSRLYPPIYLAPNVHASVVVEIVASRFEFR